MQNGDIVEKIVGKIDRHRFLGIVLVDKYPWLVPTIIGRLTEEIGINKYIILTTPHIKGIVDESLSYLKGYDVDVIVDQSLEGHLIEDNVFDTALNFNRLFNKVMKYKINDVEKIVIDVTGCDGSAALPAMYSASKIFREKAVFTVVDNIPMYGLPAYPGSPRWLHRVYVFGEKLPEHRTPLVNDYPKTIEWRGSRGIFIAMAKVFNALTRCGCLETYYDNRRESIGKGERLEAWIEIPGVSGVKKRLFIMDEIRGPDENTASMIYSAWKHISELLEHSYQDKQALDRMIMQIQRYVGSADLIIKEAASSSPAWFNMVGEKLHRVLVRLSSEKNRLAVIPDTNLFYQGLHMALLKASIRVGNPWSPIRGLSIYVPLCAEAEINGKVAETNPDAGIQQRIPYTLALLANRALLETKYYYDAVSIPATAQPCEASIAVTAPNLTEHRILLITADHKAFTAWQTLNVCRGKIACAYISHSDKPLDTDTIYGRFYTSISASLLAFIASLFLPVTIRGPRGQVRLIVKNLKGSNAPVVGVHKYQEQ